MIDPTFRTEALILVNFLSVKPHISLSQELQQMQVLVGQIEHEEPLPRDVEHMNPHKVVEDTVQWGSAWVCLFGPERWPRARGACGGCDTLRPHRRANRPS